MKFVIRGQTMLCTIHSSGEFQVKESLWRLQWCEVASVRWVTRSVGLPTLGRGFYWKSGVPLPP